MWDFLLEPQCFKILFISKLRMITKFDLGDFYVEITEKEFSRLKPGKHKGKSSILSSDVINFASGKSLEKSCFLSVDDIKLHTVNFGPKNSNVNNYNYLEVILNHPSYSELDKKGRMYIPYGFGSTLSINRFEYTKKQDIFQHTAELESA